MWGYPPVIVREDVLGKARDHRGFAHLVVADHDDLGGVIVTLFLTMILV